MSCAKRLINLDLHAKTKIEIEASNETTNDVTNLSRLLRDLCHSNLVIRMHEVSSLLRQYHHASLSDEEDATRLHHEEPGLKKARPPFILLSDVRNFGSYEERRIQGSINVCAPPGLALLGPKSSMAADELGTLMPDAASFCRHNEHHKLIVYGAKDHHGMLESTRDNGNNEASSNLQSTWTLSPSSLLDEDLVTLMRVYRLLRDSPRLAASDIYWMVDGFDAFRRSYPDLCTTPSSINKVHQPFQPVSPRVNVIEYVHLLAPFGRPCKPASFPCKRGTLDHHPLRQLPDGLAGPQPLFVQILPGLYLSDIHGAQDVASLQRHHIGRIMNVSLEIPNYFDDGLLDVNGRHLAQAVEYKRVPLIDSLGEDLSTYLPEAIQWLVAGLRPIIASSVVASQPTCMDQLHEYLEQHASLPFAFEDDGPSPFTMVPPTLVHCHAGRSRSVSVLLAFLMTLFKRPLHPCHQYLRHKMQQQARDVKVPPPHHLHHIAVLTAVNLNFMGQLLILQDQLRLHDPFLPQLSSSFKDTTSTT